MTSDALFDVPSVMADKNGAFQISLGRNYVIYCRNRLCLSQGKKINRIRH